MITSQWSHTLVLIGGGATLLIAIVYVRTSVKVRKQGRRLGWFTTIATVVGIAVILYVAFHGDAFQFLLSPPQSRAQFLSGSTPSMPIPVAHVVATAVVHRPVNHVGQAKLHVSHRVALPNVAAQVSPHHLSSPFSLAALPSLLIPLEGIASVVGIILALSMLLMGLTLLMRHSHERQEAAFLATSSSVCATCGMEGEFPSYRDTKGQLAHLCTDCVPRFQVTPIA